MKILLDTHIFLWALAEPHKLSESRRADIESPANIVYVSAISIAEIMIKASLKKLNVPFDPVAEAEKSGFEMLDFNAQDALRLGTLPFHHRDPFDRMLITQSLTRSVPLMTDDAKFERYDCRTM